jgi:hypothetical protein
MKLKNRFVRLETNDETADEQWHMEIYNNYFDRYINPSSFASFLLFGTNRYRNLRTCKSNRN